MYTKIIRIIIAILAVIYLYAFFITPYEPYSHFIPDFRRWQFFLFILQPEFYFNAFSVGGLIVISDKFLPFFVMVLVLLAANGIGGCLILLLRKFDSGLNNFNVWETKVIALMFGLGFYQTLTLAACLCGLSTNGLRAAVCSLVAFGLVCAVWLLIRKRSDNIDSIVMVPREPVALPRLFVCLLFVPAIAALFASGILMSNDYDVLSYHAEGAKEIFLAGGITFAQHNVYMNMPFGAEMNAVIGMTLMGDVIVGESVGKLLIAAMTVCCAFATALFCYRFLPRDVSAVAAPVAALIYLQFPLVNMVSAAGLVDCVFAAYLMLCVYMFAALLRNGNESNYGTAFLCGIFAGLAAACKYTAVPFLILPLVAVAITFEIFYKVKRFRVVLPMVVGIILGGGLWYIKNAILIGNPFFPLLASVFPVESWDAVTDQRWRTAHAPHSFSLSTLWQAIRQVVINQPLLDPLLIPLAILGAAAVVRKKFTDNLRTKIVMTGIVCYVVFFFAAWFMFTHRLDRFWLPIVPLMAILAGTGTADVVKCYGRKHGKYTLAVLLVVACIYTTLINTSPMPGKNVAYLVPLNSQTRLTEWTRKVNDMKRDGELAIIGEASVFDIKGKIRYATCWNKPPLEDILTEPDATKVTKELKKQKITLIMVHWGEIKRFRSPNNYGFSNFPTPQIFQRLTKNGVLEQVELGEESKQSGVELYRVRKYTEHD
ncbi:MAG: glycosyltransferase family 39 protein [Planctomycetaceae bacterium]|jgi:4-amino-4-deoxy-L-arabinose transferase-like glycosyltransferase|nr:glycosyltransferase family 39 protein [Planctomycetaceae bacterium]